MRPAAPAVDEKSAKRKRANNASARTKKFAKISQPEPAARKDSAGRDDDLNINGDIARMDGQLLSDYVVQKAKYFEKHLTTVELEDKLVSSSAWSNTADWSKPRDLDHLPDFLEHHSASGKKSNSLAWAPEPNGAPHTILVTGAALRAADISRAVRKYRTKSAAVAKLFAKHIKLKDAEQFVKSSRIGIAVGTPARLIDLLDLGALSLDKLQRLVVDGSHIDQKKRTIFDMRETLTPLLAFLNRPELKDRYGSSKRRVDLLVY
ncbi:MAG: hypothetical protein M1815_000269 [Lichina confinis]|nr:MAG: hypothetical protein M1815_000269 [Lichina confinis]